MRIILILIIMTGLPACANMAVSGAQAVYNRHSLSKSINDNYETFAAYQAINKSGNAFKGTNITIATYNDEMLIAGQVPEAWQRVRVEQIIRQATEVSEIHNALTISNPSSSLTRLSDAWITTKVKTKLLASDDVDVAQVKVITENGTVYLMGILAPDEAQAAVSLAQETEGVRRVVKVFRYIHITKV